MNIILLGSGNTATVLAKRLIAAGHTVVQVWSRNPDHAATLARQIGARPVFSLQELTSNADICIIAVADNSIADVAAQLNLKKIVLVHTAGSVSIEVLRKASPNYGVLYPLQSLRKDIVPESDIPFLIDGNSGDVLSVLNDFASSISGIVLPTNDDIRLKLHVAAVVVNNFTNHLYAMVSEFCKKEELDFQLLRPLIQETAMRLNHGSPGELQTGPAMRNDSDTITRHLELLMHHPDLRQLYLTMTHSILGMYHKKEELRKSNTIS